MVGSSSARKARSPQTEDSWTPTHGEATESFETGSGARPMSASRRFAPYRRPRSPGPLLWTPAQAPTAPEKCAVATMRTAGGKVSNHP